MTTSRESAATRIPFGNDWESHRPSEIEAQQWDAIRLLLRANVLMESGQAMKSSELFWGEFPGQRWDLNPRVHPPSARPRNDGVPVIVLNLSFALRLKAIELVCEWMAGRTASEFMAAWIVSHSCGDGR